MKDIAISVIIPVYNAEAYLEECLNSAINQTFENYEVICVNDASTDSSAKILEHYQSKYEKMKVIHQKKNSGQSRARNIALKQASGKYIVFLDSDDIFSDTYVLEELYVMAEEKQLDILYFNYVKQYDKKIGKQELMFCFEQETIQTGKQWFCRSCQNRQIAMMTCRQFLKREFLLQNKICFFEGIVHEDMLFSFFCVMNAKRVMETGKVYYIYRQHPNSTMTTYNKHRAQSMFVVLSELLSYWTSHDFTREENEAIEYYIGLLYKAYKKYRHYSREDNELECGNPAEKFAYKVLKEVQKFPFEPEQLRTILNAEKIILYGAGAIAEDIIYSLRNLGLEINYLAVTDASRNPKQVYGIEVKEISEFEEYKETAAMLVSVRKQFKDEVVQILSNAGYKNIVIMNYDV